MDHEEHPESTTLDKVDKNRREHQLWEEIDRITNERVENILRRDEGEWSLVLCDGNSKMYRKLVQNGLIVEPVKIKHKAVGVTSREVCEYFFNPKYRLEWDFTVDNSKVVEEIDEDTIVFQQLHKKIWPFSQRQSIFWSHRRRFNSSVWSVVNYSTVVDDIVNKIITVNVDVSLVCETEVESSSRSDLTTMITYCSAVDPGGWVPAAATRQMSKREYPKFIKRFSSYVYDKCKNRSIMF